MSEVPAVLKKYISQKDWEACFSPPYKFAMNGRIIVVYATKLSVYKDGVNHFIRVRDRQRPPAYEDMTERNIMAILTLVINAWDIVEAKRYRSGDYACVDISL